MSAKNSPQFAQRPGTPEAWVQAAEVQAAPKAPLYDARLTLDVTKAMRGRIKVAAFRRGITVADMLRGMLDEAFPADGPP